MPSWKKVIISGSDAALHSLNVSTSFTASGLNYPISDNGGESFMQTDGSGNLSFQYVKTIYEQIYNGETTTILKGDPLYISGSQGANSIAFKADAANPAKMPVTYISADNIAPGATGRGIVLGLIKGVDTTGYPAGTEVYVAPGGGWTKTRPTGSNIVQLLGIVTKEGTGGQGIVLNPGPVNLPNLSPGNVWVGNLNGLPVATPTSSLSVASASFASTSSFTTAVSGTTNYIPKFTASGTIGNSLIYDNGTNVVIGSTTAGARLDVRAQGALATDIAFRVRNSADSADLFSVNGAGQVGIGTGVDGNTLPSRLKINPLNSKVANIGYFAYATLPSTINDGDLYVYGGNLWLNSEYKNTNLKGDLYKRMKLTGLQPDFFYGSFVPKNFNQFSSSNYNTFGYGSLVHTGYSYGQTVLNANPTSIGVDSRMYDGFLMSVNGPQAYDPNPQLFVDIKGNIFARGNGSYAESDWKKALTDNANKTTTVGSETNYPSAKFAIDSTTQGFLPPRMTTTQRDAIATPAAGLVIYNTTTNTLDRFNGTSWNAFESVDNKVTDLNTPNNTTYPTTQAVSDALALKQDTLTNPITGTGANGQVAFFNGTTTQTGDNGLFWDNTNKRLGIGTTSPSTKLHVNGDFISGASTSSGLYFSTATDRLSISNLRVVEKSGADIYYGYNNTNTIFRTGTGTERMRITDTGQVTIGATTAGARLDVRAQGAFSTDIAFRVRNSTNTQNFLVVNGAGDVSNSGAGGGETNTQFGINSGRSRTGAFNSLFGNQAGRDLTTGAGNTLFGFNAGTRITTQNGNTLIGARAGESTIVNNTVAVGANSLLLNQTGTSNVAVGTEALYYNTASGNTAVGDAAGLLNTTGQRNIFLGYASGRSNTTGQYNTYIGVDSGTYQTTGNDNIFVGVSSGRYEADGVTNLTTAINSLFIGNNTRGNASGQTNQIVIGHNAIGNGSNSVTLGNDSITKTVLKGNVGIGTTSPSPSYKLDVNGSTRIIGTIQGATMPPAGTSGGSFVITQYPDYHNSFYFYSRNDSDLDGFGTVNLSADPESGIYFDSKTLDNSSISAISFDPSYFTLSSGGNFYFNTKPSTSFQTSLFIKNTGEVGIGTVFPTNKLTILGTDDTIPALGSSGGKLGIFNGVSGNPIYGLLQGVLGTGNSYLQVQRVDGTATAYSLLLQPNGGNVGIGTTSPSTLLDVNGWATFLASSGNRLKIWDGTDNVPTISADNLLILDSNSIQLYATDVKDSIGESIYLKLVTVSGNTTITDSFHNKIVRITASCTITIPTGLRTDFNCTFEVIGAYTAQFVDASGVTTSAPFGRYLKTDLTAMFYCTGTASNYRLNGSLTTS